MSTVLVIANETVGGRHLIGAVRERATADPETRFVLCVPLSKPKSGLVVYDDAAYDAAQIRVDLARDLLAAEGIKVIGEVGDPDPYSAALDAVHEYHPDEIIISTYPETRSGWLGRDLIERVREASRRPVTHVVNDPDSEGLAAKVTLAVANRTASGEELLAAMQAKVEAGERRVFIVVVPLEGGDGNAVRRARTRLKLVLERADDAGLVASGMIGDPDPYTAVMNALQYFRINDIIISTLPETKSGWLRADLVERVRRASGLEIEHIVQRAPERTTA